MTEKKLYSHNGRIWITFTSLSAVGPMGVVGSSRTYGDLKSSYVLLLSTTPIGYTANKAVNVIPYSAVVRI